MIIFIELIVGFHLRCTPVSAGKRLCQQQNQNVYKEKPCSLADSVSDGQVVKEHSK
jgi:hypothetical protein